MANYYYVTSALPRLEIGTPPDISFREFGYLMEQNLDAKDLAKAKVLRLYYDIENIRSLWREEPLDPLGNLGDNELDEALLTREGLPEYVYEFMEKYDSSEARLRHFPRLLEAFFREEIERNQGFLREYLTFEREWRLVMLGFRAKKALRDVVTELQYEDPHDDLVAQILAQRDVAHYEPPYRYEDLKPVFERFQEDPLGLAKALQEYRFQRIRDLCEGDLFSMDRILGYLAQLIIVERWQDLDKKQGQALVEAMVNAG